MGDWVAAQVCVTGGMPTAVWGTHHITVAVILLLGGPRQANYVALSSLPLSNKRNGIEGKGCVLNENSLPCNVSAAMCSDFGNPSTATRSDFIALNSPWRVNPVIHI